MTTLIEQSELEIARMVAAAHKANQEAEFALGKWRSLEGAARQAEKDYNASKKIADETNAALIKALGGDG